MLVIETGDMKMCKEQNNSTDRGFLDYRNGIRKNPYTEGTTDYLDWEYGFFEAKSWDEVEEYFEKNN